jgi:leucyl-tRNA synthetase
VDRAVDFLDGFYRLCVRFPDGVSSETVPDSATRAATTLEAKTSGIFSEVGRYLDDYRPNAALERLSGALKSIEEFVAPREAGRLAAGDRTVVGGILRRFAIALVPFAPHLAEEASEKMGHPPFAARAKWPSRIAQLIVAFALATGCAAHHKAPAATIAPAPRTDEGVSKATYIFDPANPALHLGEDVQFDRPRPDDANALPVYPEHALRENAGTHREVVRIIIDTNGKVSEVLDSPLEASEGGPYASEFRSAVDTAVRSWRFQAGYLRNVVPGNDVDGDGKPDYKVTTAFRPVAVYYDVRFTFEIVNGRGVVTPR